MFENKCKHHTTQTAALDTAHS